MEKLKCFQEMIADYIFVENELQAADVIFIPGNAYPQMAEKAASLYLQGYAPYVLPSGRYSTVVGHFPGPADKEAQYCGNYGTEWEFLQDVLLRTGVPASVVLHENQATYTYENALYSRKATDAVGLDVKRAIICCRNLHARRCLMYYQLLYPETEIMVSPVVIENINRDNWTDSPEGISAVMGEVQRIITQFNLYM